MSEERPLDFKIARIGATDVNRHEVTFDLEIIDEYTLITLERRYKHKLQFDGGRTYTMKVTVPMKGMAEQSPEMWVMVLRDHPDIAQKYVLARLKGEI